jgi:hypothetical protein
MKSFGYDFFFASGCNARFVLSQVFSSSQKCECVWEKERQRGREWQAAAVISICCFTLMPHAFCLSSGNEVDFRQGLTTPLHALYNKIRRMNLKLQYLHWKVSRRSGQEAKRVSSRVLTEGKGRKTLVKIHDCKMQSPYCRSPALCHRVAEKIKSLTFVLLQCTSLKIIAILQSV